MRGLSIIASLGVALLLCGCAGYQLGPTGGRQAGEKSVEVQLFGNTTMEPRLSEPLNTSLRRALQQDGTFHLETAGASDYLVTGNIVSYERPPITFQPSDVITVRDYYLQMSADVRMTERATGKVVAQRTIQGKTLVRTRSDQSTAERIALPLLTDDLARKITSFLADGDW